MGKSISTYPVKIKDFNHIFHDTVEKYRDAVNFFIDVALAEWENVIKISGGTSRMKYIESITCITEDHPNVKYNFTKYMYKFPSYCRRTAIMEAIGKVSSYKSNYANWEKSKTGKPPRINGCGYVYPAMYRGNCYKQLDDYHAQIKVYIRNTWDWITVELNKSDMDYIKKYCKDRKHCVPTLQKRGKEWFLDFAFKQSYELPDKLITEQRILACDLGINNACACSVMDSCGAILGRRFLDLPREKDSMNHALNRVKKAQQHGNRKMPRLWARVNGLNDDIAVKTAKFIIETAILYDVDVIVMEHLDLQGKKHGSKKQRLHLWKVKYVQEIVEHKAHVNGIKIRRVCAWGTSALAYDGSGKVLRGEEAGLNTYSLCKFTNGKIYNCDLSASYNIGARYFIRELLKSGPVTAEVRLRIEAKVPECGKRSTCTLSTLISLNAELAA